MGYIYAIKLHSARWTDGCWARVSSAGNRVLNKIYRIRIGRRMCQRRGAEEMQSTKSTETLECEKRKAPFFFSLFFSLLFYFYHCYRLWHPLMGCRVIEQAPTLSFMQGWRKFDDCWVQTLGQSLWYVGKNNTWNEVQFWKLIWGSE